MTTWTPGEIAVFDRLIDESEHRNQLIRVQGRLALNRFALTHGKEKCDAMFAHLENERKQKESKNGRRRKS